MNFEFRRPTVTKISNTEFEINWVFDAPEKRKVCVYVGGIRKVQGFDYVLKFTRGMIKIIFDDPIDENVEVEIF